MVIALHAADSRTRALAVGGILLAVLIALLYLKTIIPIMDISFYVLISFFSGIMIIESNHKYSWIFYLASVVLSFIIPINKLAFLLYYSYFGVFGIIKYYIEKIKSKIGGHILKIGFSFLSQILRQGIHFSFLYHSMVSAIPLR